MMLLSFLPMLSMFNETIKKISSVFYSQQISRLINGDGTSESTLVIGINFILLVIGFIVIYRKKGIE